jgi:hypothetical protein
VLGRFGSNETRTSGAPVTVFVPKTEVLSLKQCAAVIMTVGDSSAPEQAKTPLSAYPTYGWASPSY